MEIVANLRDFLDEKLFQVRCSDLAKSYLTTIFVDPKPIEGSLVLAFAAAREKPSFEKFQQLGDWSTFMLSMGFVSDHKQTILLVGSRSYLACNSMLRREWKIYDELGRDLRKISRDVHLALSPQACSLQPAGFKLV